MSPFEVDVLCIGTASYDLVFPVARHPGPDEKMVAEDLVMCGGGPAANAAVAAARLGGTSAFAGYLGSDDFGDRHMAELEAEEVHTGLVVRGEAPTTLSVVLVKPNGERALVNHGIMRDYLPRGSVDFTGVNPRVMLLDGHQPFVSRDALDVFDRDATVVLDAGSVHRGTEMLLDSVDYLVCSETFAVEWTGESEPGRAASALADVVSSVVVTLGRHGLVWKDRTSEGRMDAFEVKAVDTTGAGDAFHGAFALALSRGKGWEETLRFASAAAALCCTKRGARRGIQMLNEVESFLQDRNGI